MLSYAFFVGTSMWAYLYAAVADAHTQASATPSSSLVTGSDVCVGTPCWVPTLGVALGGLGVSFLAAGVLWRAWRERV